MKSKVDKELKVRAAAIGVLFFITVLILVFTVRFAGSEDAEDYNIVLITKVVDSGNDFWTSLIDGAKLCAEEYGAVLHVAGASSEKDVEGQKIFIEKAMEMSPDALVISPSSYTCMTQLLKEVKEKGIKLILIDSVIDEDIADGLVSTDNFLAGKALGEYAKENMEGSEKIGIIAHVRGSSTAIQREAGIKEGLGKYEKNVVSTRFCGSSYDEAYAITKNLLEDHPDVKVVFGTNEYASVGAARAVHDSRREDVHVYGFDNSIEEIQLLEQGVFDAIVIQKSFNMGYLGIEQAVLSIDGHEIEEYINSGFKLIDKNNMYEDENQRLLYPFTGQK